MLRKQGGLAQSVECDVRNVEAEGSKPSFSSLLFNLLSFAVSLVLNNMYISVHIWGISSIGRVRR